ncbi:putative NRPS-like enzyme [Aspergillus nomiae NRRL 13137]|uniref:Putative NRPS-like enzyme n=1 Tax=Aspergillus nomiae NRRL (strain ATCC 15546 / NRRL 13137 / CBS 260.88 / M93) TaxID=1509407 RepID=A0A0L1JEE9_ASPN3|nr:putative NRPS-like enzyme [Aspergillus nomiae NRRL 13137]KNG89783.1 putative NRPS-like enzyme [Aspergillus nomiae NRRL 13137]
MYLAPPPFHAAGPAYLHFIILPIGVSLVLPISGGFPTAAAWSKRENVPPSETALIVPSIVQELAQSPDLLDLCSKHLTHLIYCGGTSLSPIGDTVAAKIKLMNQYGVSEVGMILSIYSKTNCDPLKDWRFIDFHPRMGVELHNIAGEEYEMVIAVALKPYLWRWCGRADDVIVFLNGEKTNPVSMEQHIIACNPDVTTALVAGSQRFQASLLVEVNGKDLSVANAVCPAHARVAKTHIQFTPSNKPMLRAGKGTIQRAGTLAQYTPGLDALYIDADKLAQNDGEQLGPGCTEDPKLISDYIRQSILTITGWNANKLTDMENWFNLGLDSLQRITATRIFKRGLDSPTLTPNLIYLHPTVIGLTQAVLHLQQHQEASTEAQKEAQLQDRDQLLQELIGQPAIGTAPTKSPMAHTVLLNGSTGNLGAYMLDTLLRNPTVRHVHCLSRKDDAIDVQRKKSEAYNLNLDMSRVSFWAADLSQPDFRLQSDIYQMLQSTTTRVIHNSWAANFNLSLASFKPNLVGVVNLINFAHNATQSPHLFFISSISSTMGYHTGNGLTPEELITTTTPAPNDYANSKYLAEHLLAQAAKQSFLRASFARVGQIAGPVRSRGLWKKAEWFPSLVLSSLHVGALPDTLGPALDRIGWVPIDLLAEVLVDLALNKDKATNESVSVFHPVTLHPLTWEAIRPIVANALLKASVKTAETIPFGDWVQQIRQDIETAGTGDKALSNKELQALVAKNPAVKLLEFFEDIMSKSTPENVLDTQLTAQRSEKLQAVEAVKPEWIQKWVGEWAQ